MAMTTKNLLEELVVNRKELICDGNLLTMVEPIYAKIGRYGDLMFKYKECTYSLDQFSSLFPQYYQYTRITACNWRVVEEEVKEKQWYESLPVARIDSDGYTIFTKSVLCNARPNFVVGDEDHLILVTGYKWFNNKTIVKFCTHLETVISSTGILPLNDMQLPNYLSNFDLGTSNV